MKVYTIGHWYYDINDFIKLLKDNNIEQLIDIRSYPGSRKSPQFNKETMSVVLKENNIEYEHIDALGGRRRKSLTPHPENAGWQNDSFKNYADYMATEQFKSGIDHLLELAEDKRVAYMCGEPMPWRCHRSIVSDKMVSLGHNIIHILPENKHISHELGRWGAKPQLDGENIWYKP